MFDENLVEHWKTEFLQQSPESDDLFDLVISFAQATAQGCIHKDDCDWNECEPLCEKCYDEKRKEVEADPDKFDFDLEGDFDDWLYESEIKCDHPRCNCTPPDFDLANYIKYNSNGMISSQLHDQLKKNIQEMLEQEPIDWHPGSNQQVRDLVHPSMFCYIKGTSKLKDGSVESEGEEEKRYQWLPSEFIVSPNGNVQISSYVNNLNTDKYPLMKDLLEQSFEAFLPGLEQVLKKTLKGKDLQVIVKIGATCLNSTNPDFSGGSWHIEGMPYEHIAATCIHYVDVKGISDSFLEFRKPVIFNKEDPEMSYPQSDALFTTHHYGIEKDSHWDGQMNRYLGLTKCHEGASIIFPNTLQHRVKEFSLVGQEGIRTILAFFVIDPNKRIVSTADLHLDQPLIDANHHRERLMFHRKYFVNILNQKIFQRPYSLCEH